MGAPGNAPAGSVGAGVHAFVGSAVANPAGSGGDDDVGGSETAEVRFVLAVGDSDGAADGA